MGATEMLINGFAAIAAEKEALEMLGRDPLSYQDIMDRLKRLSSNIHGETGFRYELPELMTLFKSYAQGVMEVAAP